MANKNQILKNSLDYYRRKSGSERINTRLFDGFHGYHLTNMGGVEMIKQKSLNGDTKNTTLLIFLLILKKIFPLDPIYSCVHMGLYLKMSHF